MSGRLLYATRAGERRQVHSRGGSPLVRTCSVLPAIAIENAPVCAQLERAAATHSRALFVRAEERIFWGEREREKDLSFRRRANPGTSVRTTTAQGFVMLKKGLQVGWFAAAAADDSRASRTIGAVAKPASRTAHAHDSVHLDRSLSG